MKVIKCEKMGSFSYRSPNIPEAIDLISKVYPSGAIDPDIDILNSITAKCVKYMGTLVEDVNIKIKKKEIKSYDEMLNHYDLIKYIMEMANDVMTHLELSIKKKGG